MPLTNESAQQMIQASQAKARELGVNVSTAIFDTEGRLFAFARMEAAHWMSVEIAQAKAFTAAMLRRDGEAVRAMGAETVAALSAIHGRALVTMDSVTPVREGDRVIAGVGISGAKEEQDLECAHAARDAFAG